MAGTMPAARRLSIWLVALVVYALCGYLEGVVSPDTKEKLDQGTRQAALAAASSQIMQYAIKGKFEKGEKDFCNLASKKKLSDFVSACNDELEAQFNTEGQDHRDAVKAAAMPLVTLLLWFVKVLAGLVMVEGALRFALLLARWLRIVNPKRPWSDVMDKLEEKLFSFLTEGSGAAASLATIVALGTGTAVTTYVSGGTLLPRLPEGVTGLRVPVSFEGKGGELALTVKPTIENGTFTITPTITNSPVKIEPTVGKTSVQITPTIGAAAMTITPTQAEVRLNSTTEKELADLRKAISDVNGSVKTVGAAVEGISKLSGRVLPVAARANDFLPRWVQSTFGDNAIGTTVFGQAMRSCELWNATSQRSPAQNRADWAWLFGPSWEGMFDERYSKTAVTASCGLVRAVQPE